MSNLGNYGKTDDRERRLPEDRIGPWFRRAPEDLNVVLGFDDFVVLV